MRYCLYSLILLFLIESTYGFIHALRPTHHRIALHAKKSSEADFTGSKLDDGARKEALSGVLYQIERTYGKGSIQKLGETPRLNIETTSSGSMTLDIALGGGYPKGRVIEIYGPESSGKTTLALHAIAEVQASGGSAAFVDAEHALDSVYARNLGVDVDNLLVCQPDSGEMALDIVDQLVRSSAVDIVVIDSVAALVPRAELEGDMGEQQMGLQARLMSKALRKITGSLSRSKTSVLFLNQLRSKIGIMFGNPEVTAGGNALKFYSSVRVDIRRREVLKDNQGITARVKVVKNKVGVT
jgi:recombination protein RecA